MNLVQKAIWYIESHFGRDVRLEDVARAAGVSRYHLTRAFGYATGHSVVRYLRGRRLSEAARALAAGEKNILALALDLGYGSHEAFTRAFREQFGHTPEQVRARGTTEGLALLDASKLDESLLAGLAAPEIVEARSQLLAGLERTYSYASSSGIPAQWQAFGSHLGTLPGRLGEDAYGVLHNGDEEGNHDYLSAVEVSSFSGIPSTLTGLRLPARRYAVFRHPDHVSSIRGVWYTIWSEWLPGSGYEPVDAPALERYPEAFDPETGEGGYEVWLPLEV